MQATRPRIGRRTCGSPITAPGLLCDAQSDARDETVCVRSPGAASLRSGAADRDTGLCGLVGGPDVWDTGTMDSWMRFRGRSA